MRGVVIVMALASAVLAQEEFLGPAPISNSGGQTGRIAALALSRVDPNLYYAAAADGGVWRTTDGGESWTSLTDFMPTQAMGALVMHPSDESILYAGTGEANYANHSRYGLGLYKTEDGGDTWDVLAADVFAGRCFSALAIHPQQPDIMYASITRAGGFPELAAAKGHPMAEGPLGVFRSMDAGETWEQLTNGIATVSASSVVVDHENPSIVYAAIGRIFGDPGNGIYKSVDGGDSWAKLTGNNLPTTDVGRISLAISPDDSSRLVANITQESNGGGGSAANRGVYMSLDAGQSWFTLGQVNQATYGWYLNTVSIRPGFPETVIAGGLELRRFILGQGSSNITPPHVDMHAIEWDAAGRLVVGGDGGVHRSVNVGNSWESLNTNLCAIQFYAGLSTSPDDDEFVFGGLQDNGSVRRQEDGTTWTRIVGGDGGWTQIDQASPNRMFAESQGTGNLYFSDDFGDDFDYAAQGISSQDRNCFLPPYLIDPSDSSRMLYATHRIYESTNGGQSWNVISGDLTGGSGAIRALAMAPSNSMVVYAATNDGRVLRSDDGGSDWELIRTGHPGWPRVTRELTVDPTDPYVVYLAVASFGDEHVLRSANGGETWAEVDGDLPDVPVNVIGVDASGSTPVLYAGTDAGLFRSSDDGVNWVRYPEGLPHATVIDILVQPERGRLVVGTQGRGAWEVPITTCYADANGDGVLDVLDFVAFQQLFVAGDDGADCNGDGELSVLDFVCFQLAFQAGC